MLERQIEISYTQTQSEIDKHMHSGIHSSRQKTKQNLEGHLQFESNSFSVCGENSTQIIGRKDTGYFSRQRSREDRKMCKHFNFNSIVQKNNFEDKSMNANYKFKNRKGYNTTNLQQEKQIFKNQSILTPKRSARILNSHTKNRNCNIQLNSPAQMMEQEKSKTQFITSQIKQLNPFKQTEQTQNKSILKWDNNDLDIKIVAKYASKHNHELFINKSQIQKDFQNLQGFLQKVKPGVVLRNKSIKKRTED